MTKQSFCEDLPIPFHKRSSWPWVGGSHLFGEQPDANTNWPRISIATPSLNQGHFLEAAIRSVLMQAYPNLEYIVIDGGSTDDSLKIIKKYEAHLSYWVSESDKGHGHALNKGFSHSTGEIMAWLNSDDMYAPGALFAVASIFSRFKDVSWIIGRNSQWDAQDRSVRTKRVYKNLYDYLAGDYKWIEQESVFWRRSLWEKAGASINEDYRFMVDGELWCRFFLLDELWHVEQVLAGYRLHEANRARLNQNQVIREMKTAIRELQKRCPSTLLREATLFKYLRPEIDLLKRAGLKRTSEWLSDTLGVTSNYKRLTLKEGQWIKSVDRYASL